MDPCFTDVTVEFLAVAFHNILYYTEVYPKSIFENRRKYSIVVHHSIHTEVNQYLNLCLRSISECLKSGQLSRIEFAVTDEKYSTLLNFVFNFFKRNGHDETTDAYLVQCERNLRTFCLKLVSASKSFPKLPENRSFSIYLHTDESSAVTLETNPDLEDFPLVEMEERSDETDKIIALKNFPVRNFNIETYIEL